MTLDNYSSNNQGGSAGGNKSGGCNQGKSNQGKSNQGGGSNATKAKHVSGSAKKNSSGGPAEDTGSSQPTSKPTPDLGGGSSSAGAKQGGGSSSVGANQGDGASALANPGPSCAQQGAC